MLFKYHLSNHVAIVNMGLIWRLANPSADNRIKADGTNYTRRDYADQLFDLILSRHSYDSIQSTRLIWQKKLCKTSTTSMDDSWFKIEQ